MIAHFHSDSYHKIDGKTADIQMVGLCDIIPGKAQAFAEAQGWERAKCYEDYREMIEDLEIDAVSICTPNRVHADPAIACLRNGIAVMCEKPMSYTLQEAVDMARTAKETGNMLTIGFQPRYDPNSAVLERIVQSGRLGQIYHIETGGGRRRGIPGGSFIKAEEGGYGATNDIGCYALDMVLAPLGYPKPLSATAQTSNYFGKTPAVGQAGGDWGTWTPDEFQVEDFATGYVRLQGDISLVFRTAWAMHMDSLGHTLFLGTKGGLKCHDGGLREMTLYQDLDTDLQTQSPVSAKNGDVDIFTAKIDDFVRAVVEGDAAPIPGETIVYNQAIIDGLMRSAAQGKEVAIDIPAI